MINYDCGDSIALDSPGSNPDQLKNLMWLIFFYDYTFVSGIVSKVELDSEILFGTELDSEILFGTELDSEILFGIELDSEVDN